MSFTVNPVSPKAVTSAPFQPSQHSGAGSLAASSYYSSGVETLGTPSHFTSDDDHSSSRSRRFARNNESSSWSRRVISEKQSVSGSRSTSLQQASRPAGGSAQSSVPPQRLQQQKDGRAGGGKQDCAAVASGSEEGGDESAAAAAAPASTSGGERRSRLQEVPDAQHACASGGRSAVASQLLHFEGEDASLRFAREQASITQRLGAQSSMTPGQSAAAGVARPLSTVKEASASLDTPSGGPASTVRLDTCALCHPRSQHPPLLNLGRTRPGMVCWAWHARATAVSTQ